MSISDAIKIVQRLEVMVDYLQVMAIVFGLVSIAMLINVNVMVHEIRNKIKKDK